MNNTLAAHNRPGEVGAFPRNVQRLAPGVLKLVAKLRSMVDVERLERRFAETVADLGLMDADGTLGVDIDRQLAEVAGGDDPYRAGLARFATDLMVMLDNVDWSEYEGESRDPGQAC